MNPAELEFLSEEEGLTIVPKFKLDAIKLLNTTVSFKVYVNFKY